MTLTHTIDRDALVQDICDMVATFSVNPYDDPAAPAEAAMADLFEAKLIALGVEVDSHVVSEGRRNVWGRLKGSGQGPTILLAGHLDTVGVDGYDAPFTPHLKDGRVYGRGSCDMKAGVASYLAVVRAMKASGTQLQGDLVVAGLVDEEHAMHGSAYFGKHGPKADYALVAEPSQLAICPMHKGQVLVTLTTTGKSVHSSLPHLGTNAVYHMAAIVTALQGYANDLSQRPPHPLCGVPSLSVGTIQGGTDACSVPDFCTIDIDRRTMPGETTAGVLAEIDAVIASVQADVPDLSYSLGTPFLDVPPLDTATDGALVNALKNAIRDVTATAPQIQAFPGSTDAPNLGTHTVICGAGNLAQCHSLNEYIDIAQVEQATQIYIKTLIALQDQP